MAEMEGFEPPDGVTRQLISSQPRYDHFDTSPYQIVSIPIISMPAKKSKGLMGDCMIPADGI